MWQILEREIERKARNVLDKHRGKGRNKLKHAERFTKRTGLTSTVSPQKNPGHWAYDKQFNPIYCISHARFLAKRVWEKIQTGEYKPIPAIQFEIDKDGGGTRTIMSFGIVDSAVANVFHRRLTSRNKGLFSAYSFAYRPDKNVFEAIVHLQRMLQPEKTYLLKYDYSKYFDTIDHDYLKKLMQKETFVITKAERNVIDAFLRHEYATYPSWQTRKYITRELGVPQGSSLSLFLSNIAAHELDMALEKANGSFVRFADDVIAIAHSYTDARNIELEFRAHCEKSGVKINFEKSSGISLLQARPMDDVRSFFIDGDDGDKLLIKGDVDFLGHNVTSNGINLTERAMCRIRRKISKIIYIHLLQYPRQGHPINPDRVGPGFVDWDLVTCLNEIRRYIYGGLREDALRRFVEDDVKLPIIRGLMAFYPLVSNVAKLSELDGWLKDVLERAVAERNRLIVKAGLAPYTMSEAELVAGSWYNVDDIPNETRLPSFVRGWRAARKYYKRYGLSEFRSPSYYSLLALYG